MTRRSTIGANPLDAVVPLRGAMPKAAKTAEPEPKAKKERTTFQVSVELLERVRNAVYWTPGATVSGLMQDALEGELARLEKKRGEPFPPRAGDLKTGRPIR